MDYISTKFGMAFIFQDDAVHTPRMQFLNEGLHAPIKNFCCYKQFIQHIGAFLLSRFCALNF